MIKFEIKGLNELVTDLEKIGQSLPENELDKVVEQSAEVLVNALKAEYSKHQVTGTLVRSIMAFKRKRKNKKDPYFTYYVGPKYTNSRFKETDAQGNAISGNLAHFLEYGTAERYRANAKKGGASVSGRVYGAKLSTGKVVPLGIIRRTKDENEARIAEQMGNGVIESIMNELKKRGYQVK